MQRGFVYQDKDKDLIEYCIDGTIIVRTSDGAQNGAPYDDFQEFIEAQEPDYLDTIELHHLLPGVYNDGHGHRIQVLKNGKIVYRKTRYASFEEFKEDMTDGFFNKVTIFQEEEESDEEDESLFNSKLALKKDEAECLATECRRPRTRHVRNDQGARIEAIHVNVEYTYPDWETEDPTYTQNRTWLQANQQKMTCILSVSLAKPDSSQNTIDDTRRTMLLNAITGWTDHNWSVLLFVPAQNQAQYDHCAKLKTIFPNNVVNIVPYRINQGTCNVNMNVGESRNAILHFLRKFIDIMKTCTVADERVEALMRPKPVLSNSGYNPKSEPILVARQRISEGYARLALVKRFLEGTATEAMFQAHQAASDSIWSAYSDRNQKYLRTIVQAHDAASPATSIWHSLNATTPTLIGLPTEYRARMRFTIKDELPKPRQRYKHWGVSSRGKFLGADTAAFAPENLVMPTQLITFKVGEGGWNGQFYYPFTTIGEDNFFSYTWGEVIGPPTQLDAITIVRKFPKRAVSITRTPDNLSTYTDCAIKELVYLINSNTYDQRGHSMPILQWTPVSKREPLDMNCYKWQAFIFSQVSFEAKQRGIRRSSKVKKISNRLLEYILSKKFRNPSYFSDATKDTYNAMLQVYRNKMSDFIKTKKGHDGKKLKIPKNR